MVADLAIIRGRVRKRIRRGSTIGEGGDTTISSPGWSPKQPFPRIGR